MSDAQTQPPSTEDLRAAAATLKAWAAAHGAQYPATAALFQSTALRLASVAEHNEQIAVSAQ